MSLQNLVNWAEQPDDFAGRNLYDMHSIYIRNIPKQLNTQTLRNILSQHGTIVSFYTNSNFVICKYDQPWQAQAAIHALNGKKPFEMSITLAKRSLKSRNPNNHKRSPNRQENGVKNDTGSEYNKYLKLINSSQNIASDAQKQQNGNKMHTTSDRLDSRSSSTQRSSSVKSMNRSNDSNKSVESLCSQTRNHIKENGNTKCVCETSENKNEYLKLDNDEKIFFVSQKPCIFCSRLIRISRQFSIHCPDDFERELSPNHSSIASKDSSLKSVHDNFETGYQIISTPQERLPNGDWICLLINQEHIAEYNSLFEEFSNECNKKNKNNNDADKDNGVVAMCIFENGTNVWYRGVALANGRYALIDKGTVVIKSEVLQTINCPEKFANIPKFCSVLTILPKYAIDGQILLKQSGDDLPLEVILKNDVICLVAHLNVMIATLTTWNPDNYIENTSTKQVEASPNESLTSSPTPNESFASSPTPNESLASSPTPIITNDENSITKPPTILMLKNNSTVIVINYVSSKEVYVRLHGQKECKEYSRLLNDVATAALTEKGLTTPPELKSFVICRYKGSFYRAIVLEYNDDDLYRVAYIDIGRFQWVTLTSMRKCNKTIGDKPMMVTRVSLKGSDLICNAEPSTKVEDFINTLIKNDTSMLCTFDGLNQIESEVQLTTQLSKTDVNNELVKLTMPVYDRLQNENKKPHELQVIMLADVDQINFDDLIDLKQPIQLLLLDTSQLVNLKYITCTKIDQTAMSRFTVISKQINEYCMKQTEHYLPRQNETCLAFDESDESWHRGVAMTENNQNVSILFLDRIKITVVHITKVRKMISDFIELPFIGSSCQIAGIPNDCQEKVLTRATEILDGMNTIDVSSITASTDEDNLAFYCLRIPKLIAKLKSEHLL